MQVNGYASTDSDSDTPSSLPVSTALSTAQRTLIDNNGVPIGEETQVADASEDDDGSLDQVEQIRANNAYTGATNSIGSVHQRHWYLILDRSASGFVKARSGPNRGRWVPREEKDAEGEPSGFDTFFVQGPEVERSVVTGRLSSEVMADEGVEKFRPRKMWRPIME